MTSPLPPLEEHMKTEEITTPTSSEDIARSVHVPDTINTKSISIDTAIPHGDTQENIMKVEEDISPAAEHREDIISVDQPNEIITECKTEETPVELITTVDDNVMEVEDVVMDTGIAPAHEDIAEPAMMSELEKPNAGLEVTSMMIEINDTPIDTGCATETADRDAPMMPIVKEEREVPNIHETTEIKMNTAINDAPIVLGEVRLSEEREQVVAGANGASGLSAVAVKGEETNSSSSDDTASETSTSSEDTEDEPEPELAALFEIDEMEDDEEETIAVLRESSPPATVPSTKEIQSNHQIGTVISQSEQNTLIRPSPNQSKEPLRIGTVIANGKGDVFGVIREVLGPTHNWCYSMKHSAEMPLPAIGDDIYVESILVEVLLTGKGHDASGLDDMEIAPDFSDDEEEARAKSNKKRYLL